MFTLGESGDNLGLSQYLLFPGRAHGCKPRALTVKQHQLLILAGTGRYLIFYSLDNILVLSVFRHYWNGLVIVLIHPGHSMVLSVVDVL